MKTTHTFNYNDIFNGNPTVLVKLKVNFNIMSLTMDTQRCGEAVSESYTFDRSRSIYLWALVKHQLIL